MFDFRATLQKVQTGWGVFEAGFKDLALPEHQVQQIRSIVTDHPNRTDKVVQKIE
jgi:hypothetical protein